MKKIVILFGLLFLMTSCSLNSDDLNVHLENLPVEEVDLPSSFVMGEVYPIKMRYYRPTSCHNFHGFYYDKELNIRTIAIQNIVTEQNVCIDLTDELVEAVLSFHVTSNGTYVFKFWQGKDDQGEDVFLEYEVPVED